MIRLGRTRSWRKSPLALACPFAAWFVGSGFRNTRFRARLSHHGWMVRPHIVLIWLGLVAGSCAVDRVAHVAPDESRPHVSWEIREGGESGDERLVCGSTEPSRPCALVAGTGQAANESTVRLFLHAAATDTSYLGLMTTPFVERPSKDREISLTVPHGSQPVLSMVTGRVTMKPGAYTFVIALDATQSGAPAPVRITQQIPVTVSAPAVTAPTGASR